MTDIEHFIESFGLRYDKFQSPKLLENENLNFLDGTCLFFNLDRGCKLNCVKSTELVFLT